MIEYPLYLSIPVQPGVDAGTLRVRTWAPNRVKEFKLSRWLLQHVGGEDMWCFAPTVGNARAAALSRVLQDTPQPVAARIADLKQHADRLARKLGPRVGQVWSDDEVLEWISSLPAKKRRRYTEAFQDLNDRPFCNADAQVTCFIKLELTKRLPGKFYKPRMIQFRTARYLVHVARWLKPLEHAVYGMKNIMTPNGGYEVAKSMNAVQRGEALFKKARLLRHPVSLSLDCTAFDAHVNSDLLKVEQKFYRLLGKYANWTPVNLGMMSRALKLQLSNRVRGTFHDGSIHYVTEGRRMSGDLNTALGNVSLFCIMISLVLSEELPQGAYQILDDGDDCVVLVESEYARSLEDDIVGKFGAFGMVLKVEDVADAYQVENIEFCQSHPVKVNGLYRMVRDYRKVMKTTVAGTRWHKTLESFREFCWSVGVGDGIACKGVPVLQSWFTYLRRLSPYLKRLNPDIVNEIWRFGCVDFKADYSPVEITMETRFSFQLAFGLTVAQQISMEVDIDLLPAVCDETPNLSFYAVV